MPSRPGGSQALEHMQKALTHTNHSPNFTSLLLAGNEADVWRANAQGNVVHVDHFAIIDADAPEDKLTKCLTELAYAYWNL